MDKLYDSEKNHVIAEQCGTKMIAPLRKKTKQYHRIKGVHRKKLFKSLHGQKILYGLLIFLLENPIFPRN